MISGEERELDLMIESTKKQDMQTKFKKGDPVVAVRDCQNGRFKRHETGVICEDIVDDIPFVQWDNGVRCPASIEKGYEDISLLDLAEGERTGTIDTPSPRLASEIQKERMIRHLFAGMVAEEIGNDKTHQMLTKAIEVINALNEKT